MYGEVPSTDYGLQFDTDLYVVSLPCLIGPSGLVSYPLRNRTPGSNIRFTHCFGPISLPVEDFCEDAPGQEQAKYLETLERVSGYQIVNRTLILYDDQGHQALQYWARKAVEPLPPMTDGLREFLYRARAHDAAQNSRRAQITEPRCEY